MKRRKTAWGAVAARARAQPDRWFLHPTLVSCDEQFYQHIRRRVPALQPTPQGRFEFAKTNRATNDLGVRVFDLYVRYREELNEHNA